MYLSLFVFDTSKIMSSAYDANVIGSCKVYNDVIIQVLSISA